MHRGRMQTRNVAPWRKLRNAYGPNQVAGTLRGQKRPEEPARGGDQGGA